MRHYPTLCRVPAPAADFEGKSQYLESKYTPGLGLLPFCRVTEEAGSLTKGGKEKKKLNLAGHCSSRNAGDPKKRTNYNMSCNLRIDDQVVLASGNGLSNISDPSKSGEFETRVFQPSDLNLMTGGDGWTLYNPRP